MRKHKIIRREEWISNLVSDKKVICVSGGYFGDEAKGKTAADLTREVDAIARVNSGQNAGHTVFHGDQKLVFHLVPSGIVTGKPTFIGANCVMDPVTFLSDEIRQLLEIGFDYSKLIVGNAFIVNPIHKIADLMRSPNASTGRGMSPVHQDIAGKRALRIDDILNEDFTQLERSLAFWDNIVYLDENRNLKNSLISNNRTENHVREFLETSPSERLEFLINLLSRTVNSNTFPKIGDPRREMTKILENGGRVLFEGPQSFFLSNQEPTHYCSTTSAGTHPSGIFAASGISPTYKAVTINVLKIPSSRVGSGANPAGYVHQDWFSKRNLKAEDIREFEIDYDHAHTSFINSIDKFGNFTDSTYTRENGIDVEINGQKLLISEAMAIASCIKFGEFGATTGKPRVCGALDLPHLAHLVRHQNKKVSLSCVDRLDGTHKIPVVVDYIFEGSKPIFSNGIQYKPGEIVKAIDNLPGEAVLRHCRPIYKVLDGWTNSSYSKRDELEVRLSNFLEYVEDNTGCKIISFGNGPKTEDMVYLSRT